MKRHVRKANSLEGVEMSPITPKEELVYSSIHTITDPDEPTVPYIETLTPDAEDAMKVLRFLDEINGIGWTPSLRRIEKELREALHDLWMAK